MALISGATVVFGSFFFHKLIVPSDAKGKATPKPNKRLTEARKGGSGKDMSQITVENLGCGSQRSVLSTRRVN